jgi:AcrR family transcriptional regulator
MARPLQANSDETRRRIVAAAIELFARDGFLGASTRELAERAGVNVATLHYYFHGKQGVYDAAVDEVYRRLAERAEGALAGARLDDLDDVCGALYRAARAERDGIRVLVRQVLDGGRLTPRTEALHFLPGLDSTAELAASVLGCPPDRVRPAVVTLGYLISRFVIQDDDSLVSAFGAATAEEAHARALDSLARTAHALLDAPR